MQSFIYLDSRGSQCASRFDLKKKKNQIEMNQNRIVKRKPANHPARTGGRLEHGGTSCGTINGAGGPLQRVSDLL